jgi:hypothetical protein
VLDKTKLSFQSCQPVSPSVTDGIVGMFGV